MKKKSAIIIGASGLTGGLLLQRLIEDESYSNIKLFSRRSINPNSSKVTEFIGDIIQLEDFAKDFVADEVYCCIGTTKAKTKNKHVYKAIDYGIPVKAAQLAKANGINSYIVVSALGADAQSNIFYNRTKGEMEQDVLFAKIKRTHILRPSLILGNRDESRFGEALASIIMRLLNPLMIGNFKKYKAINADSIAKCMHKLASFNNEKVIIESDKIKNIANC